MNSQLTAHHYINNLLAEGVKTFPEDNPVPRLDVHVADGALEILSVGNNIKILQLFVGIKVGRRHLLLLLDSLGSEVSGAVSGAGLARPRLIPLHGQEGL